MATKYAQSNHNHTKLMHTVLLLPEQLPDPVNVRNAPQGHDLFHINVFI